LIATSLAALVGDLLDRAGLGAVLLLHPGAACGPLGGGRERELEPPPPPRSGWQDRRCERKVGWWADQRQPIWPRSADSPGRPCGALQHQVWSVQPG
jgi:hypothetical protein